MKKVISGLFMCAALVAFASCKKDKKTDCKTVTENAQKAFTAYGTDQSTENCKKARAAYEALLTGDCAGSLSAQEKEIAQGVLEAFDCEPR